MQRRFFNFLWPFNNTQSVETTQSSGRAQKSKGALPIGKKTDRKSPTQRKKALRTNEDLRKSVKHVKKSIQKNRKKSVEKEDSKGPAKKVNANTMTNDFKPTSLESSDIKHRGKSGRRETSNDATIDSSPEEALKNSAPSRKLMKSSHKVPKEEQGKSQKSRDGKPLKEQKERSPKVQEGKSPKVQERKSPKVQERKSPKVQERKSPKRLKDRKSPRGPKQTTFLNIKDNTRLDYYDDIPKTPGPKHEQRRSLQALSTAAKPPKTKRAKTAEIFSNASSISSGSELERRLEELDISDMLQAEEDGSAKAGCAGGEARDLVKQVQASVVKNRGSEAPHRLCAKFVANHPEQIIANMKGPLGHDAAGLNQAGGTHAAQAEVNAVKIDYSYPDFAEAVGGLKEHIQQLQECCIFPLFYPSFMPQVGSSAPKGLLLQGPPGTGKTLIVRALAGHLKKLGVPVTLFARKGGDLLSKWVGEGEANLTALFEAARRCQPSIIFFDELDGLAPLRQGGDVGDSSAQTSNNSAGMVTTLLAQLDGLDPSGSGDRVIVVAATNRPDAIDPALRRPGRLERELRFDPPRSPEERGQIFRVHTKHWKVSPTEELVERLSQSSVSGGMTGADIEAVCKEATLFAVRRTFPQIYSVEAAEKRLRLLPEAVRVVENDFMHALKEFVPTYKRTAFYTARSSAPPLDPSLEKLFAVQISRVVHAMLASLGLNLSALCASPPLAGKTIPSLKKKLPATTKRTKETRKPKLAAKATLNEAKSGKQRQTTFPAVELSGAPLDPRDISDNLPAIFPEIALIVESDDKDILEKVVMRAALEKVKDLGGRQRARGLLAIFSVCISTTHFDHVVETIKEARRSSPSMLYLRGSLAENAAAPSIVAALHSLVLCQDSQVVTLLSSDGPNTSDFYLALLRDATAPVIRVEEPAMAQIAEYLTNNLCSAIEAAYSKKEHKEFMDKMAKIPMLVSSETPEQDAALARNTNAGRECVDDLEPDLRAYESSDWGTYSRETLFKMGEEERHWYRLFRVQIRDLVKSIVKARQYRIFRDLPPKEKFPQYPRTAMCTSKMLDKVFDFEYESLAAVQKDIRAIAKAVEKYNPEDKQTVKAAYSMLDECTIKTQCVDEEVTKLWANLRARRESRKMWASNGKQIALSPDADTFNEDKPGYRVAEGLYTCSPNDQSCLVLTKDAGVSKAPERVKVDPEVRAYLSKLPALPQPFVCPSALREAIRALILGSPAQWGLCANTAEKPMYRGAIKKASQCTVRLGEWERVSGLLSPHLVETRKKPKKTGKTISKGAKDDRVLWEKIAAKLVSLCV